MKKTDRVNFLKENHWTTWIRTRSKVFDELSDKQTMFCCCGKLATGFHEQSCTKFNKKVDLETADKLKNLESDIESLQNSSFMSSESTGAYPTRS